MELRGEVNGIRVFDDFAHHPTAIALTLDGLRQQVGGRRIIAVLEPRSNTMRMGVHAAQLPAALNDADQVWVYAANDLGWDPGTTLAALGERLRVHDDTAAIVTGLAEILQSGDQVVIMSNGGFEGVHDRLLTALEA